MNVIEFQNITKHYRSKRALQELSFSIKENTITGLVGRNGSGKTTLLRLLAGFMKPTSGEITVFSEQPFNNLKVSQNMIVIDEKLVFPNTLSLLEILQSAASFYPNWDMGLAKGLLNYFSFDPTSHHQDLSKGMKSSFHMIIGLAARCPVTMFDEPTTGMDATSRKDFYRALLKDYIAVPRTIILSSHHLNEIEDIIENLLLLHDGRALMHSTIEELRQLAIAFHGKTAHILELIKGKEVVYQKEIGTDTIQVVVRNDFSDAELERINQTGIQTGAVTAEDICVYLTNKAKGEIDDVFNRH